MIKATLEIGEEQLDVLYSMFEEDEGVIYAIDGDQLVGMAGSAVDDCALLRPIDGHPLSISIVRSVLTFDQGWSIGSADFVLRTEPPSMTEG